MSHTTKIKTVPITDINALRSAIQDLCSAGKNIELIENAVPRMFYDNQVGKMPFVAKIKDGQYDVGFEKQKDGSYIPVMDSWGGHLSRAIGASCPMPKSAEDQHLHCIGQLMQGYSKHAAINAAVNDGFVVQSCEVDENGEIQILLGDFA